MTIKPFDFIPQEIQEEAQAPEIATQFVKGAVESALTSGGTTREFFESLADFVPQSDQAKFIRREATKALFPHFAGPSLSEVKQKEKEYLGDILKPKTVPGRIAQSSGEFFGQALTDPKTAILSAIAGGGGQLARELGSPESLATFIELGLSPIAALAKKFVMPHIEGTLAKSLTKEQIPFYNDLKELGLSDKQITPLIQSETKVKTLGRLAKKTPEAEKALFEAEESIGSLYKPVKEKAASFGKLSQEQLKQFNESLEHDLSNLKKGVNPSDYKQEAIDFLEKSLEKNQGHIINPQGKKISYKFKSPEDIITFFQEINEQGLYDKLKPVKETIHKFLNQVDPKLAKMFDTTNQAYSKIMKMREAIGVGKHEKLLSFIEKAGLIGALAKGLVFGGGWAIAAPIIGESLARKLSTKMLFDPRYQNILKSTIQAGKQNLPRATQTLNKKLEGLIKEDFPEESENINWNTLY